MKEILCQKTNICKKDNTPTSGKHPSHFFYNKEYSANWLNDNLLSYAINIEIEKLFCQTLKFDMNRIIYSSNDNSMYKREEKNCGKLNLPYLSYHQTGYSDADRDWFNNWANLQYPLSHNNDIVKLGQKIKIFPVKLEYEGVVVFDQHKDMDYAYKQLAYVKSNETILFPQLESTEHIVKNIGIFNIDIDYNPSYAEKDWLVNNKIYTLGLDFSVDTFQIMGDLSPFAIAKSALAEFIVGKYQLDKNNVLETNSSILLSDYFEEVEQ